MAKRNYDEEMKAIEMQGNLSAEDYATLAQKERDRNTKIDGLNRSNENLFYNPDGSTYQAQKTFKYQQNATDPMSIYGYYKENFGGGERDPFNDPYAKLMQTAQDKYYGMNYDSFLKGNQYKDLANRYGQQGQMAMQNTLGQIAARTGGMASSYASSAAAQAYNNYMNQLSDAAMSMYNSERSNAREELSTAMGLSNNAYGRWMDEQNMRDKDRSYEYGMFADALGQSNRLSDQARADERYAIEDGRYDQEYADKKADQEYQRNADMAKTLAGYGDFSGFEKLGYTPEQISKMQSEYNLSKVAKSAGTKKASSGGGDQDYDGLFQAALDSGNPQSFLANNYKKFGFSSNSGLWNDYQKWAKGNDGEDSSEQIVTNPEYWQLSTDVYNALKGNDVGMAEQLLSKYWDDLTDWQRASLSNNVLKRYGLEV